MICVQGLEEMPQVFFAKKIAKVRNNAVNGVTPISSSTLAHVNDVVHIHRETGVKFPSKNMPSSRKI